MKFNIFVISFFFIFSCTTYQTDKKEELIIQDTYSNKGFTLLYEPSLKKIKKYLKILIIDLL